FANFGHLERADLERFAQAAGLDLAKFRAALDDRRYRDAVVAEAASAEALGVDGTPTVFLNGAPVSGARDASTMDRLVEAHLRRVRGLAGGATAPAAAYGRLMSSARAAGRADPSRIPTPATIRIELRSDDRARAVEAACRRRDAARAAQLAGGLAGEAR